MMHDRVSRCEYILREKMCSLYIWIERYDILDQNSLGIVYNKGILFVSQLL